VSSCVGDFLHFIGVEYKGRGAIIRRYRYALACDTVFSVKLANPDMEKKCIL
jgi:hypothetical protein